MEPMGRGMRRLLGLRASGFKADPLCEVAEVPIIPMFADQVHSSVPNPKGPKDSIVRYSVLG